MRKVCFVLGTMEWRAVQRGETLTDWTFGQLDRIAREHGVDASIVFAVDDPYLASKSKTDIGIERIRQDRPRVLDEVSASSADLVMMFGPVAAASLLDHGSMTESDLQRRAHFPFAKSVVATENGGADSVDVVVPGPACYYTSSIEQIKMSPGMVEWWDLDIAAALKGYDDPVVDRYGLNDEIGAQGEALLQFVDLIGFDLETTGLDPWASNAAIRMAVFSWRYAGSEDITTHVYDWDRMPAWAFRVLADAAYTKVGANVAFDVRWCKRFGVEVRNYQDVLTTEHVLCPGNPRLTLKDLGFKYFPQVGNYHRHVYALAAKYNDDWSLIPAEEMYEYCAADGQVSLVAAEKQRDALRGSVQSGKNPVALLSNLYPILTEMSAAGARIDPAVNAELDELYQGKMAQLKGEINQVLGPVNLNSPDQLAKALKQSVPGLDLSPRRIKRALGDDPKIRVQGSANGFGEEDEQLSTDRATLEREAFRHPVIQLILAYRKYRVRHSTFIEGIREKHLVQHHGMSWIHPDFRSDVTDTYRLSSRNPNGQNMPRSKPDPNDVAKIDADPRYSVKRQFVSRFPGGSIVEGDMSQVELRVAAWLSGDQEMIAALTSGGDIHREMAARMLGKSAGEITPEERQEAKTNTFLIMYGGGARKLAEELKVPFPRAQALIKQYFGTYRGLRRAIDEIHAAVERDHTVETPFGFRRLFFPPDNWMGPDGWMVRRQAWNTHVQNTAACLMYCAMIRFRELWENLKAATNVEWYSVPFLQIHDSIVVDTHPQETWVVARMLQQAVREAPIVALRYGVEFDLPLGSDVKIGPNWGEVEKT